MGGRGQGSMSGGKSQVIEIGSGEVSVGDIGIMDATPDSRRDIQEMFVGQTGFGGILGTDKMDTAVLGAYGIQLNNLERRYGAIGGSENVKVGMVEGADFVAAVSFNPKNPSQQTLIFNHSDMGKISSAVRQQRESEKSGWSMPTNGSIKSLARYTVTHEYGHLLHNQLYAKAVKGGYKGTRNEFVGTVMTNIAKDAMIKYGGMTKDLSGYSKTNSRELFAETFANANLGKPNAMGKAMNDWLKKQGF